MMKFLVAIAMFTLIGFSLSSAAAIETGENDTPKSMNDFKENLKNLLDVVSEAIQEKAESDENMDLKDLIPEIKIHDEDDKLVVTDEESSIETEEDEDPLSDEISTEENAKRLIHCSWYKNRGSCCKRFTVSGTTIKLHVCITAYIYPPRYMKITLRLNGHEFWRHTLVSGRVYRVCWSKRHLHICFRLFHVYISSRSVHACLSFHLHYHGIHYGTSLGCFYKRFGENEISTNEETPLHFLENQKHTDDLFFHENEKHIDDHFPIPKEMNQNNDVFGFDQ